MIPLGGVLSAGEETLEETEQPSRTYRIDWSEKRAIGTVDGIEAVTQSVYKILQTDRFENLIYSSDYGAEYAGLHGNQRQYIQSELRRRIREALLQDDRITGVEAMEFRFGADSVLVEFTVVSTFGNAQIRQEVMNNG
ncbi:hypothetical protein CIG75_18930 [Tumebacillus algifaecis]|uniref:DUF2634 domain-containing protein n=1 Tax=Tumebacillus algifaecis TaxID=1214604 RepID=A0A223D5N4_9BACL|nr:DUF2634 domain-containing protein [Tumebacillus algifaecis]ASS76810.1 hypothetical protein CIG75_18930 [Tumebacillus algifaecis]